MSTQNLTVRHTSIQPHSHEWGRPCMGLIPFGLRPLFIIPIHACCSNLTARSHIINKHTKSYSQAYCFAYCLRLKDASFSWLPIWWSCQRRMALTEDVFAPQRINCPCEQNLYRSSVRAGALPPKEESGGWLIIAPSCVCRVWTVSWQNPE